MIRLTLLSALILIVPGLCFPRDQDDENEAKTALQALNDFIGDWNGNGGPEARGADSRDSWQESVSWIWRFKGEDVWLAMTAKKGKILQSAELRYLPDKKRYQLTAVDKKNAKRVYEGALKNGYLVLDSVDKETNETRRITMNSAGDGVRFVYRTAHKPDGRTLFTKDYQVAFTKQGEALAAEEKKVECPVSGGLGKIPVTYKGVTYYVCCTGCRDAFNENPEKYVREFEAKKKK
jgi:YHS domain